ncbi:hypothetical protein LUZ60_015732 [Juncus effusus]|nr:hypothetical protein LUZ60_015732 [Juncus effusus]
MIQWGDIYKVVAAMVPLYVALGLGYGSVRCWKIFTAEQCNAINSLVALFTIPFFTFEFTVHTNPYTMNYKFIACDTIAKLMIITVLFVWVKCSGKEESYGWSLTCFSLSTLNNTLVVGVPLFMAMYGKWAQDLIVQLSVIQAIVWFPFLLFGFEVRKAEVGLPTSSDEEKNVSSTKIGLPTSSDEENNVSSTDANEMSVKLEDETEGGNKVPLKRLIKTVWMRLVQNPNFYASILGVCWACIANKWHIELPAVVEGSVQVMSRAGTGTAMFSMGLFMGQQEKAITCGPALTVLGMVLRFLVGPATALIGAAAVGLRGDLLRLAIIQAALPQSISSFIFAKEYGLHADVLNTAVIFGTLVSLPVLIAYYTVLGLIN